MWRTYFPLICLVFRFSDKADFRKSKFLTDGTEPTRWCGLVLYKAADSVRIPCLPLIITVKKIKTKGKIKVDRILFGQTKLTLMKCRIGCDISSGFSLLAKYNVIHKSQSHSVKTAIVFYLNLKRYPVQARISELNGYARAA